jgi:hypothetical protein
MPSAPARIQNSRMNIVLSLLGELPLDAFRGAQLRAQHDHSLPTAGEPNYV